MNSQRSDGSRRDILIVDDKPANLRLLAQMLAEQGFTVRAVTSGARALAALQSAPSDLVLLDIKMPGMNGYEVCARLKADAQTRDIPVIFISSLDEVADKLNAFSAGGVDYVTKPFQLDEVLARVETHLALRDLQRRLQDANRRLERELALAGSVQASFLPKRVPDVPGWQLSMMLRPARETSGDFYDMFLLQNGRVGIVIADVVDKGAGAALYMALSCTLLRTYVEEYPEEPARVFASVNRRLLTDTDASEFVTVFYAILDPATGGLAYANGGHHPPYVVRSEAAPEIETLSRTGIPLGIFGDQTWEQGRADLAPGDVLVLYTDGVTDAQGAHGTFFGADRLLTSVRANVGRSAKDIQDAILADIDAFAGDASQGDDIALVILVRDRV
ncbi:MAG: SpoIIE family protein phosphatase [Anaerolineae bacterium]|jgi:serine phosphatase RsbU (regulator of sigma subunit)